MLFSLIMIQYNRVYPLIRMAIRRLSHEVLKSERKDLPCEASFYGIETIEK